MRTRLLTRLSTLLFRRPLAVIILCLGSAIISAVYAVATLRLNSDPNQLIAPDRPFMVKYRRFLEEFGDLEYILVVVDAPGNPASSVAVVDDLLHRLPAIPGLEQIHGVITPEEQLRLASRTMTETQLRELLPLVHALSPYSAENIRPATLLKDALQGLETSVNKDITDSDDSSRPLVLLDMFLSCASPETALIPTPQRRYLTSPSGRFTFIRIQPREDFSTLAAIDKPLADLRLLLDEVQLRHPGVEIGLTGKPVLQTDEMLTTRRDMIFATLVALFLITTLFMIAFRGLGQPLLAVIALVCGISWTFGLAALVVGQLNLLSIVFTIILVGVGIDYGIHLLSRFREFRRDKSLEEALTYAMIAVGRGNVTGAVTSSCAFFGAMLGDFKGLRELGFIAGFGLLFCLISTHTVLPALLIIRERRRTYAPLPASALVVTPPNAWYRMLILYPQVVVWGLLVGTLVLLPSLKGLKFEHNLLKLQALGLDSVEWEHRLLEESSDAVWFGAVMVDTQEELGEIISQARGLTSVGYVSSVFDLIQPDTDARSELRGQLHERVQMDVLIQAGGDVLDAEDIGRAIVRLHMMAEKAGKYDLTLARRYGEYGALLEGIGRKWVKDGSFDGELRENLVIQLSALADIKRGDLLPLREALPGAMRDSLVSEGGRYLAMIHPRGNVWEYDILRQFVADLRSLDPEATGVPMTHFESLNEMQRAFRLATGVALVMVFIILVIDFRRWRDALLAMLPVLVGLLWLGEVMAIFEIRFNLANFFAVPILIGLGVDNGVHLLHRYREQGGLGNGLGATSRAVGLTSLTTIIGFGMLTTATHRGLHSLGLVMAIGVLCCWLSSMLLLPAILGWRERGGERR